MRSAADCLYAGRDVAACVGAQVLPRRIDPSTTLATLRLFPCRTSQNVTSAVAMGGYQASSHRDLLHPDHADESGCWGQQPYDGPAWPRRRDGLGAAGGGGAAAGEGEGGVLLAADAVVRVERGGGDGGAVAGDGPAKVEQWQQQRQQRQQQEQRQEQQQLKERPYLAELLGSKVGALRAEDGSVLLCHCRGPALQLWAAQHAQRAVVRVNAGRVNTQEAMRAALAVVELDMTWRQVVRIPPGMLRQMGLPAHAEVCACARARAPERASSAWAPLETLEPSHNVRPA